jgi:hypothetical protein
MTLEADTVGFRRYLPQDWARTAAGGVAGAAGGRGREAGRAGGPTNPGYGQVPPMVTVVPGPMPRAGSRPWGTSRA